jgi:putative membrane protein (fragment)
MIDILKKLLQKKIVLSLLLSLFALQLTGNFFLSKDTQREVRIEATGKKNAESKSNGVQIKEILLDGQKNILPVDFFTLTSWEVGQDGTLTWNSFKNRNTDIIAREKFRTLRIGLTKEEYSGIAKIYVDGTLIKEVDLYSKQTGIIFVDVSVPAGSSANIIMLKFIGVFATFFIISYILCIMLQRDKKLDTVRIVQAICISLIISLIYIICFSKSLQITEVIARCVSIFGIISIICTQFINIDFFYKFEKKQLKKIIISCILLVFIWIPIVYIVKNNSIIKEEIKNSTETTSNISLESGVTVKQDVNVVGKPNKLHLNIENKDDNEGSFIITAIQNKNKLKWSIEGIDCNNRDSIPLDLSGLSAGEFFLYIESQKGESEKSVKILTSDDTEFGTLKENDTVLINTNLMMSVELTKQTGYYRQQIILSIFLLFTLTLAIGSVLGNRYSDKIIFVLVTISIFLIYCIKHPTYFLDAQPIYETGSNFFLQTYERGFAKSLFVEDFVYWPLFTRLLSDIVVVLFRQRRLAMFLLNCMGGIIVALNCSLINLRVFRINLGKYERFVLSLILGASPLFGIEALISLHNSVYWNFILLTLILTVDWNKLRRYQFILVLFSSLMIVSKILFVVMFPVYIIVLVFLIMNKQIKIQKRLTGYLLICSFMTFISLKYTYDLLLKGSFFNNSEGSFGERILTVIRQTPLYYYRTLYVPLKYIFHEQNINPYIYICIAITITVVIFMWLVFNGLNKYLKHKSVDKIWDELIIIFYMVLSILTAGFLVYTNKEISLNIDRLFIDDFILDRRNFIIVVEAIIFMALVLRYFFINSRIALSVVVSFAMLLFLVPFNIVTNTSILSDWTQQYKELYRSSYVIPIVDGYDLFLRKNAFAGYVGGNDGRYTGAYNYIYSAKTIKKIDPDKIIYSLDFSDVSKIEDRDILEIYVRKSYILQSSDSYVLVKDKEGNIIAKVDATYSEERQALSYILPDGIKNIGSLEFYYSRDNAPYPLLPEVYLGIEGEYEE